EEEIVHATIASAGENLNDSVIAPIFYFLLLGVTGAVIYRVINSVDAMIGYHTEKYEYFGKFAARLDDAVNFIPARITALLILISSLFIKKSSSKNAFNIMLRDNGNTPSINGGWPMAALAGALRITITKPGHYSIGDDIDTATPEKILLANRFIVLSTAFFLIICFLHLQYGLN
ncbi:MAG: adenosylcobinamide-phosphate synthase CbiB, partial [Nitrospinota bacterium]